MPFTIEIGDPATTPFEERQRYVLRYGEQVVGCAAGADVHLTGEGVERMHATLWAQEDLLWVTDLGSESGTRVNGTRIERPFELSPGDRVAFGQVEVVVRHGDVRTPRPTRISGTASTLASLALAVESDAERLRAYYEAVYAFSTEVGDCADEDELAQALLGAMMRVCDAQRYRVMLGRTSDALRVKAQHPEDDSGSAPSAELLRRAMESERPLISFDAQVDERFRNRMSVQVNNTRSVVAVRLLANDRPVGLAVADSAAAAGAFTEQDADCLDALGRVASVMLLYLLSRRALAGALEKMRHEVMARIEQSEAVGATLEAHVDALEQALEQPDANKAVARMWAELARIRTGMWSDDSPEANEPAPRARPSAGAPALAPEKLGGANDLPEPEAPPEEKTRLGVGVFPQPPKRRPPEG